MKLKIKLSLLLLFFFSTFYAQVGIGTTSPNAASILDISSTNSGLLIPRVALTSASDIVTIVSPITSLLVYNSGFAPNGYYYWNGTLWVQLAASNTAWTLTGNTGTSSATNFLGTTDDVDIVFKRNNIRAGFIGNPNTAGGNKNTSFGANSLNAAGTGIRNTAIGSNVMPVNTSGQLNVSIGDQSMFLNTDGTANTAIGVGALYSNISGKENVALGRNTMVLNNANNNTGLGFASLRSNVSGTNNIAIGHQAGYNELGNNKLYIENSTFNNGTDSSVDNALIYGEFDNRIVRTNGTIQIGNPATTGYSLPIVRGTNGQVLQTNGAGATSWANPLNTFSLIRSTLSANQVVASTGWQKITFDTVAFDLIGGEFSPGTNRFVATKAGYYEINAGFHTFNKNDAQQYAVAVYKNGIEYQETAAHHYGDKLISRIINCTLNLAVNDYVEIYIFNGNAPTTIDNYSGKTYFEVKQIK
ncbi:hypothetical protein [Flavobacterium sp.]|uniref:hypothetical protein n=1 Tax=Flavobacterium sp. TaxID=239 RepID=UPI0024885AE2|nr:hypothetical protein [Flavobacterium sp.]MDI1315898.1 hypothetical protein [Flavobacterium sp.]